MVVSIFSYT
uniref:Uncharacterized protein n=1 Tax=Oryza nivara TaxID=4536 RepID=A0A0G2KBP7_ORYNI